VLFWYAWSIDRHSRLGGQESKDGLARVQEFLEQVALWSEPEKAAAEEEQEGSPDVVNVMTLHLSKGLEFAVVFIVGKPIQCLCPLSSAPNVLYAFCSSAVIDRLPEALYARHGRIHSANSFLLHFCSLATSVTQPVLLALHTKCLVLHLA